MRVNALSFFLLLIAREIWTWSQQSRGFVKHKRTPGFYHTMPVKRAVQPFSCCSYCAAVILLLRTSCCRHWSSTCRKHWHTELFRRSWVWGSARSLCGELRYFLCLYLSHYNEHKYITIFCLLPVSVLRFLHYDSFPNMMKVHVSCLPKPPLQSWQSGCDGPCAVWLTGRVCGSLTQWPFLVWADGQYLIGLIYLKSATLGASGGGVLFAYESPEIKLFQIKHKQLCQDRVKELSEIFKRGGQRAQPHPFSIPKFLSVQLRV